MILSKNTHLDMFLKEFKIDQSKKGFLLGFVVISKKIPTHTQDHGDA